MATALPYIAVGLGLYNAYQANQHANRQQQLLEQQFQATQPTPEQVALYNQMYSQLQQILDPNYSAVPQSLLNEIVQMAAQDISRNQQLANEQALRNLARRGLAGSSLVDQANVRIADRANELLANARTQAQMNALNLSRQIQQQAMNLAAGLSAENAQQRQLAFQSLINQAGQASDTFARAGGSLLGQTLFNLGQGQVPGTTQTQGQGLLNPLFTRSRSGYALPYRE